MAVSDRWRETFRWSVARRLNMNNGVLHIPSGGYLRVQDAFFWSPQ
ncbi:hypothetical protein BOTU111922_22110 [Bordetella tumulicola]